MRKFGEIVKKTTRKPIAKMESGNATLSALELFTSNQGNPTLKLVHKSINDTGFCDDVIKTSSIEDFMKSMTRMMYLTECTIGENAFAEVPIYYEPIEETAFVIDKTALEEEAEKLSKDKKTKVEAFSLLRQTCLDELNQYVSGLDAKEQDPKFGYEYTFQDSQDENGNATFDIVFNKVYLEERIDTLEAVNKVLSEIVQDEIPYYVYTEIRPNRKNPMWEDCVVQRYTKMV